MQRWGQQRGGDAACAFAVHQRLRTLRQRLAQRGVGQQRAQGLGQRRFSHLCKRGGHAQALQLRHHSGLVVGGLQHQRRRADAAALPTGAATGADVQAMAGIKGGEVRQIKR